MNGAGLLARRTALVLGLDEIGAGIARRFAREGATLGLADPGDPSRAVALAAELRTVAVGTSGYPTAAEAAEGVVAEAAGRLGGLDILICNLLPESNARVLAQLDDAGLIEALSSVHLTFVAMRAALPALQASGRGRIVIIGHRYGESVSEGLGAYNAAAWSLVGLARTAAVEWGPHQITTNVLMPLARTTEYESARTQRPAVLDRLVEQLPLRRVGDPVEDVGGAAVLLASDTMRFVNGEVLHADGGQHVAGAVLNPARFAR